IIAVVIVLAMNLVGSLLISALIIFPALSAMRVFKSFRSVTIASVLISMVTAFVGLILAIGLKQGLPVGPTIVMVQAGAFAVFFIAGMIKQGVKR
ncbi:MAG TPA: ABC transporter, partial [Clostridiales bacterium]|nr:ABC transporter [Clostridiales bacterium]